MFGSIGIEVFRRIRVLRDITYIFKCIINVNQFLSIIKNITVEDLRKLVSY